MNDDKNLSAAPGVTKEVEDAIDVFNDVVIEFWNEDTSREQFDAARAALLAAIAKYGNDNWLLGYDNRRDAELEQAND